MSAITCYSSDRDVKTSLYRDGIALTYGQVLDALADKDRELQARVIRSAVVANSVGSVCKFSGADWLRENLKYDPRTRGKELSPLARKVADILGQVYGGLYHLPDVTSQRWFEPHGVFVRLHAGHELASFDGSELTALVVLCHDAAIRFAVSVQRVRRRCEETRRSYVQSVLALSFHQRRHGEGHLFERHPTMDEAVERFRRLGSVI
jgi:hypothetical protein